MSSIPSILVHSTMSTIKKELEQLEQWLSREWSAPAPAPTQFPDTTGIYQAIQQLSKQLEVQQHTLNHIIDRMDVLEDTKEIHISSNEPWLDSTGTLLQNELDENLLDEYEPIINVNKTEEPCVKEPEVKEPEVKEPEVKENVKEPEVKEPEVKEPEVKEPEVKENVKEPEVDVEEVEAEAEAVEQLEEVEAVEEEVEQEVEVEVEAEEVEAEEVEAVEEEAVEEEEEAEEEEEEEQEDMEYEEIEYNGSTYYRDTDKFVYSMNEDGELSDHPIGYWKEKSKTITFYKK